MHADALLFIEGAGSFERKATIAELLALGGRYARL